MPGSFLDSNVLVYLASSDSAKAERASEVIASVDGTISVQVLNEVAHVARRKMKISWDGVGELLALLKGQLHVVPMTLSSHEHGVWLSSRYQLSVYDGQIVAAALESGCDTLWSEDMHDGLVVESRLTIRNPFAPQPAR